MGLFSKLAKEMGKSEVFFLMAKQILKNAKKKLIIVIDILNMVLKKV